MENRLCESCIEQDAVHYCEMCDRWLCEACWGTETTETVAAVMYDKNMEGHPSERDKLMCDECMEKGRENYDA